MARYLSVFVVAEKFPISNEIPIRHFSTFLIGRITIVGLWKYEFSILELERERKYLWKIQPRLPLSRILFGRGINNNYNDPNKEGLRFVVRFCFLALNPSRYVAVYTYLRYVYGFPRIAAEKTSLSELIRVPINEPVDAT